MARARSPNRDKAREMWLDSGGDIKLKDVCAELGLAESQVRKWKSLDKWDDDLKGNVPFDNSNVTNKGKPGAPKGNKNAVGNEGGAPKGNSNAVTHGFFQKYLPNETLEIMGELAERSPLDIIMDNIVIQQAAFLQAQSRAMGELRSLIRQCEEMCRQGLADEEQLLRIKKLKGEVSVLELKATGNDDKPIEIMIKRASKSEGNADG